MSVELCATGSKGSKSARNKAWLVGRWFLLALLVLAGLVGGFMIWLRFNHHTFIYAPENFENRPEAVLFEPFEAGRKPMPLDLFSADGTRLRAYWLLHPEATKRTERLATMLFLHGNAGNCEEFLDIARTWQRRLPVNVLAISYRGFGYSEKKAPDMAGIRMDSQAALDYLLQRTDAVDPNKILLYGHSMGGAVALHLLTANSVRFRAVFIENTFLSIPKMAAHTQPALQPFVFLVTEVWDNEEQLRTLEALVRVPELRFPHMMLISGEHDTIVPKEHMEGIWQKIKTWRDQRQGLLVTRSHLMECKHTCYKIKGYFEAVTNFFQKAVEDQPHGLGTAGTPSNG